MTFPAKNKAVLSGQTIGILGGGQLGRMMALAARAMGFRVAVLDPAMYSPCGQVADHEIIAEYKDLAAAVRLANLSDVVTYEFENVDAEVALALTEHTFVPQGANLLRITQHRLREKQALQAANVRVAPFSPVSTLQDLKNAVAAISLPAILKTTRGGYDGKNQWQLHHEQDVEELSHLFEQPLHNEQQTDGLAPYVLEGFVPFVKELSAIVVRSTTGQTEVFPVAENIHVNGILHLSMAPARVTPVIAAAAQQTARQVAESLDIVGLLAVEMFLLADGTIYVNELAPRPHNSGHYTMDACNVSQFEQHIRAVCGWTLPTPELLSPVVMVNILGQHTGDVIEQSPSWPGNVRLHLYGKADAKTGRKMGHANVLADSVDEALAIIDDMTIWRNQT